MYCSSDWWSGNSTISLNSSVYDGEFYFKGHNILTGAINQMLSQTGLKRAERVTLAGNSAGGLGALMKADYVRGLLE